MINLLVFFTKRDETCDHIHSLYIFLLIADKKKNPKPSQ